MSYLRPYWGDLAAVGAAFFWSLSVIYFKKAGVRVGPVALNLYKNTIALFLVLVTLLVLGQPLLLDLNVSEWGLVAMSSILGITIGDSLLLAALNRLGAGLQAIVDCLYSPTILILAYYLYAETLSVPALFGGLLVVSAIFVGAQDMKHDISRKDLVIGIVYGASSHIIMGLGILMLKEFMQNHSILWLTGARMFIAQVALLLIIVLTGKSSQTVKMLRGHGSHFSIWVASVLGTYLATLLWTAGFKWTLAGKAAIYNQTATVFIIIFATVLLKEKLTRGRMLAAGVGIVGALIVSLS